MTVIQGREPSAERSMELVETDVDLTAPINLNHSSSPSTKATDSMDVNIMHSPQSCGHGTSSTANRNSDSKINTDLGYSPEVLTGSQDSLASHQRDPPLSKSSVQTNVHVCDYTVDFVFSHALLVYVPLCTHNPYFVQYLSHVTGACKT